MVFSFELNDAEILEQIKSELKERISTTISGEIKSWIVERNIKDKVNSAFNSFVDDIIAQKMPDIQKDLNDRIDITLDNLIKAKLKKAMK